MFKPVDPEAEQIRWENAKRETHPLVRAAIARLNSLGGYDKTLMDLTQMERLLAVRRLTNPSLSGFVDFLEIAIGKLSDVDINDIATEYFKSPFVKEDLAVPEFGRDGYGSYMDGKALEKAWDLLKVMSPPLRGSMSYLFPLNIGAHTKVKAEQLATLPEDVLEHIISTPDFLSTDELEKLRTMIRTRPDQFSDELQKSLRDRDEGDFPTSPVESVRQWRQRDRKDRSDAMLDEIFAIRNQMSALGERLDQMEGALREKRRGLFG